MEKHEFVKRIEELRPILRGRWRRVALRAGVEYHTVNNYLRGAATDPELRVLIITACEDEVSEINKLIKEVS